MLQSTDSLGCLAGIEYQRVQVEFDRVDCQDARWSELVRL